MAPGDLLAALLRNQELITVVIAWSAAQLLKAILEFWITGRVTWRVVFGTGGMPSSHSATVTALATAVAIQRGLDSVEFAIAAVLAVIVMTDAAGVRRAAGRHASILNWLLFDSDEDTEPPDQTAVEEDDEQKDSLFDVPLPLQELLGHTPAQVFVGALLGIGFAILVNEAFR